MVDLKKEIKLSDLVRKTAKAGQRSKRPAARPSRPRPAALGRKVKADVVGMKIGATQLAAAVVKNDGGAKLLKVARQSLPPGIVSDGEVQDVAALAAALQEFFTVNELPKTGVRLGLATNHVGVRVFEIAGIDDDRQLANAVLFRAHDAVSIPVDEAIIDYRVISEEIDETGTINRRILLVAAYREPVERYTAAFRQAGIRLSGVDLEAFGLLRAVSAPPSDDARPTSAVVAVNIGYERATLAVSDGTICEFTRVLGWGGAKLASAIQREVGTTAPEAREMLLTLDLDPGVAGASTDERVVHARDAARRELQGLARELVASLEFYQGQPESLPISEILIAGGTSRIRGLAAELERLTRVRVRLADPLARVQVHESIEERDDLASLAVAIGLGGERLMRAVNLLPDSGRDAGPPILTTTTVAVAGASLLAVLCIFLGVVFVHEHSRVSHRESTLASIEDQVAKAEAAKAALVAKASGTATTSDSGRVAAFDNASSVRMSWDNLLDDVSRVLPRGSWLSSLSMHAGVATPAPVTTAAPTAFTVSGIAFSQNIIAQVMQRLALIPSLSNITLQSSSRADVGTTKAYSFTMSANINLPAAAQ